MFNKINKTTHIQNIKYCRYIYLWALFYLLNLIDFSPSSSLIIIVLIEIYNHISNFNKVKNFSNKFLFILLADIFLLILVLFKSKKLFIIENLLFFIYFNIILIVYYKTNILILNKYTNEDDKIYKNETYINYLKRVYNLNFIEYFFITLCGIIFIKICLIKLLSFL